MTEPEEPTRWKHGAADAPDGFADLARADTRGGPSDAALSRVIDKLALQVSAPQIAHAFRATSGAAPAAGLGRSVRFGLFSKVIAAACVVGALAIGLFVLSPRRAQAPQPAPRAVASQPVQPQPNLPSTSQAAPETAVAPAAAAPEPAPTPPTPARRPTASASAPDPVAELHLLELAQQALRSDPARALAIAEQHKQRFAHGQFAQEREMLAIQALVALGQNDRAAARARAFARRYPDSSHLPHLRDLVHTTP